VIDGIIGERGKRRKMDENNYNNDTKKEKNAEQKVRNINAHVYIPEVESKSKNRRQE